MPPKKKLEQYLADTEEPSLDVKLLAWWQAKESKWLSLANMVMTQYFAAPASSAGVERVFSAAGNMHGVLQKWAKDSTLEHSLFATGVQHELGRRGKVRWEGERQLGARCADDGSALRRGRGVRPATCARGFSNSVCGGNCLLTTSQ